MKGIGENFFFFLNPAFCTHLDAAEIEFRQGYLELLTGIALSLMNVSPHSLSLQVPMETAGWGGITAGYYF